MKVAVGIGPAKRRLGGRGRSSSRRPNASASITPGRPRRGATTPPRRSATWPRKTSRIKLGTGIIQAAARTPANIAMISLCARLDDATTASSLVSARAARRWSKAGTACPSSGTIQRLRETDRDRAHGHAGRARRVRGQVLHAPAARRRRQGPQDQRAAPARCPIYLATLSPKSLETDRRARRRLDRHLLHPRARRHLLRPHRQGRREGRPHARRHRPPGRRGRCRILRRRREADPAAQAGPRLHASARWVRASTTSTTTPTSAPATPTKRSPCSGSGSTASATKRPRSSPTRWCCSRNLIGTEAMVRDRIRAHKAAGVDTISVAPAGHTLAERIENLTRVVEMVKAEG